MTSPWGQFGHFWEKLVRGAGVMGAVLGKEGFSLQSARTHTHTHTHSRPTHRTRPRMSQGTQDSARPETNAAGGTS